MTVSPSSEELYAEAEHLRLAQEAGEIGTWEWDLASGRMVWSAQMFRNLGLEPGASGDLYPVLLATPRSRGAASSASRSNRRRVPHALGLEGKEIAVP